jgi:hypothetical protein
VYQDQQQYQMQAQIQKLRQNWQGMQNAAGISPSPKTCTENVQKPAEQKPWWKVW